ncbi:response regulator [Crenobacter caeni]|uniref:Response regulator n=1 Tax=Crenobacter caeni TaxID=2705474 RepID=A0A6B2KMJ6_9NEIS|nr:response regulator [Crenobacter caeni]NDV11395.1 response regulator [Crenobacter caeni]
MRSSSPSTSFQTLTSGRAAPSGAEEANPYRNKLFLVVDSVPEMQRALAMTLSSFGAERVEYAGRASDALAKLGHYDFDVVLCDYDLGKGYDGLYLFEEARARNLIKQSCVFMVVTGERRAQRVISAAELAPDDYLLKPFTGEELRVRLERALRRREAFRVVDDAIMRFEYMEAIAGCERETAARSEFSLDFMRLKGSLCLKIGDWERARTLYMSVLQLKPVTWAKLGLGKALTGLKQYDEARLLFEEVLRDNDRVMEAYDWLAKIALANHDGEAAQGVLATATRLSPVVVRRQKQLSEVALANGDLEAAETACTATLELARYSWHRDPALYATLARVQLARGDKAGAARTLGTLRRDYKYDKAGEWMADVVDSQLQRAQGNKRRAEQLIAQAGDSLPKLEGEVGSDALLEYARTCYQQGRAEAADAVVKKLVRNHHDDEALLGRLGGMFDEVGRAEAGRELIASNVESVVGLNNAAVRAAHGGHFDEAIALFARAHADLPDNLQVMLNMCNAIMAQLVRQGWHESHARNAHALLQKVRGLAPDNGKFQKLLQGWNALMAQQGRREWVV